MSKTVSAILVVIVGGILDAISGELIDHKDFNFHDGMLKLFQIGIVGGVIALAAWVRGITQQQHDGGKK